MNFWESQGGYDFSHKLLELLYEIVFELRTANELKKQELDKKGEQ